MSRAAALLFEPRKTPVQARSAASVRAIMQATIQILLRDGRSKLTTTRIAARAGVSVGTLYQYFPNKSSLLQAVLKEHLDQVALAVETACDAVRGAPLSAMAEAITFAFVQAKLRHIDASAALYSISDDVEGQRIARGMHTRATHAMAALFETAPGNPIPNPHLVAQTILSAMAGVSRSTLERGVTPTTKATMQQQLTTLVRAYLGAAAAETPPTSPHPRHPKSLIPQLIPTCNPDA